MNPGNQEGQQPLAKHIEFRLRLLAVRLDALLIVAGEEMSHEIELGTRNAEIAEYLIGRCCHQRGSLEWALWTALVDWLSPRSASLVAGDQDGEDEPPPATEGGDA